VPRQARKEIQWPTDEQTESAILYAFDSAINGELGAGMLWYFRANELCQEFVDRYESISTLEQAAGILAAISPMKTWDQNVKEAHRAMKTGRHFGLPDVDTKVKRMLGGFHPTEVLKGPGIKGYKVYAFYECISDPQNSQHVVIDRHMWNLVLLGNPPKIIEQAKYSADQYEWAEQRFVTVAEALEIRPHQLQAIAWLVRRRQLGIAAEPEGKQLDLDL